jgi:hypothetical protein
MSTKDKYLDYKEKMDSVVNDTVLSRWGMYTQDERYKNDTMKMINQIKNDMKINDKQAAYMLYYLVSNNITDYDRAKEDMKIDKNFEMYQKHKKMNRGK